ncbi:MAG: FixH family protein [Rhizomicrobium sp.]
MTRTFTGRDLLIWLTALFVPVIAVNVYFIVLSVTTFRGEDEQKPYLQGIEYNDTLARRAEQARLGWHAAIAGTRQRDGAVTLAVAIAGRDGTPVRGVALSGELRHPADENRDRTFQLVERAPGQYEARLAGVSAGAWDAIVTSPSPARPFEASRRLWIR